MSAAPVVEARDILMPAMKRLQEGVVAIARMQGFQPPVRGAAGGFGDLRGRHQPVFQHGQIGDRAGDTGRVHIMGVHRIRQGEEALRRHGLRIVAAAGFQIAGNAARIAAVRIGRVETLFQLVRCAIGGHGETAGKIEPGRAVAPARCSRLFATQAEMIVPTPAPPGYLVQHVLHVHLHTLGG